jgi:serine/threonine protein kinase
MSRCRGASAAFHSVGAGDHQERLVNAPNLFANHRRRPVQGLPVFARFSASERSNATGLMYDDRMTTAGPAESLVTDCLLGRYELLMPVATGGMAVVWAARLKGSRGFTKLVAIKTMRPELGEDSQFEHMLFDEATLASQVRHPHVVEIMDLGDEKGIPYIVMEWIDGEPLHVLIKAAAKAGGIPLPIGARIVSQACAGLHAAHELRDDAGKHVGLVHRDVSPQNVLVSWDGVAKVVDFGVAKAIGRASEDTRAGQVKGKIGYLAPEQARGGTVDRRSDVFALGILLFMLTTGKHPYRGPSEFKSLAALCGAEPLPRAGKVVPGYPATLEKVVAQALEKNPDKRFQTANEMLRALDHALPGNKRISTDEEVADFIRPLLGLRFETRRARLKEAQRLADERAAGTGVRRSFTTEALQMVMDAEKGTPVSLSPISGISEVEGKDADQDDVLCLGMSAQERASASRAVAGIVQRLRGGRPSSSGIVITGASDPLATARASRPEPQESEPAEPSNAHETKPAEDAKPAGETKPAEAEAPVEVAKPVEEAGPPMPAAVESEPQRDVEAAATQPGPASRNAVSSLEAFSRPRALPKDAARPRWVMPALGGVGLLIAIAVAVGVLRSPASAPADAPASAEPAAPVPAAPSASSPPVQPSEGPDAAAPSSSKPSGAVSATPKTGAPKSAAPDLGGTKKPKTHFVPKGI